jgi:hypothetical protein
MPDTGSRDTQARPHFASFPSIINHFRATATMNVIWRARIDGVICLTFTA